MQTIVDNTIRNNDMIADQSGQVFVVERHNETTGDITFQRISGGDHRSFIQPWWKLQTERFLFLRRGQQQVILPGKVVQVTPAENQISELCDQLMQYVPSPCARELIYQIRNLAGAGKYTRTGSCANGNGIGEY